MSPIEPRPQDSKLTRTRFAPSPTGLLHVGAARTALFAWLVARQAKGQFILRIEDTDRSRHNQAAEEHIAESLNWLGLNWDEGPLRQSDRLEQYLSWAKQLVDSGRAYPDPYSPKQVEELRQGAKADGKPFLFRDFRPSNASLWDGKQPLRFRSQPKPYQWEDAVMGKLSAGPEAIDDFVIIKQDGFPTYNFAHIVDDYLMRISHVIRSQEFLPSVPRFLNLYEALGIERPILATLPYVLADDGKRKLSKRDGAKDILDYRNDGYLVDAMVNFLATLGWNDGTEQEIFSRQQLIESFDLSRVQKSGARFDERRLLWMNGHYIRQLPAARLYELSETFWPASAKDYPEKYKREVLALMQDRLKYLAEIPALTALFFEDLPADMKLISGDKFLSKYTSSQLKDLLIISKEAFEVNDFSLTQLNETLNALLKQTTQKPAVLFSLIRVATTWAPSSPGLADTMQLLGKDKCLLRIDQTLSLLEK